MEALLWVLAGLVATLAATGWLCQRLRLPPALGYLVVGMLAPTLGQLALGALAPGVRMDLGDIPHIQDAGHLAALALLFFIGLELDLRSLRQVLRETRVASVFNVVVPSLMVAGFARLLGWTFTQAIVLGLALSLSSTIFGERLSSGPAFPANARKRMFGVLLAEDVAAAGILTILAVLADASGSASWTEPLGAMGLLAVSLLALATVALLAVPRILDRAAATRSPELVVLVAAAFLLLFGAAGAWAGSAELGAFLAGMAAAEAGCRFVVRNALSAVRHVGLAVFFLAAGLLVDPALVVAQWPLVLACSAFVIAGKAIVHIPATLNTGAPFPDALRAAFAMSTVGEFSLILVGAATAGGLAHPAMAATVTGTVVTLLVAAPLLLRLVPLLSRWSLAVPKPIEDAFGTFAQTLRRRRHGDTPNPGRARHATVLVADLILIGVMALAAMTADGFLARHLDGLVRTTLLLGLFLAFAAPLAMHAFQAYRRMLFAFLRVAGVPQAHDILKVRTADALVLVVAFLLGGFFALLLGASWLVAAGALAIALALAGLAWRLLARLTGALQETLARVLGDDGRSPVELGDALLRYGWDLEVLAASVPPGSVVAGRSLADLRLPETTGATVAVIQRRGQEVVNPSASQRLRAGDTVILLGDARQLRRAEALIDSGEGPLRMVAETRAAAVVDVELQPGCPILVSALNTYALEEATGVRVLGVWPLGQDHAMAWHQGQSLQAGDRVIAIGTPIQAARLREHAQPHAAEAAARPADARAPGPAAPPPAVPTLPPPLQAAEPG